MTDKKAIEENVSTENITYPSQEENILKCNECGNHIIEKQLFREQLSLSQAAYNKTGNNLEASGSSLAEKVNEVEELKITIYKLNKEKETVNDKKPGREDSGY